MQLINVYRLSMMIVATPLTLLWIMLYMKYNSTFDAYISNLDPKEYRLSYLYFIGMGFVDKFHINIYTRKGKKKIKDISEIKGAKYAQYYYYIIVCATITYILTLVPVAFLIGALTDKPMMLIVILAISVLLIRYLFHDLNNKLDARREELLLDLPQVLSKMALLINSGMVLREAWKKTSETGDRALFQEMRVFNEEVRNGASDYEAFMNFADRCSVKEIRKVISTLMQNMQKGNKELAYFLESLSTEMWDQKKAKVRQMGEKASTNLLLPIGMIFMGILILIIVPVFASGF